MTVFLSLLILLPYIKLNITNLNNFILVSF